MHEGKIAWNEVFEHLNILISKTAHVKNGFKANPVKCAGNYAGLFAKTAVEFAHVYAA